MKSMLSLAGVRKRFPGRPPLLEGVDLELPRGAIFGLIGPASAGKSVLLKLICGLLRVDTGQVSIGGVEVTKADDEALAGVRGRIGMLFQNNALFDFMDIADNVAFPLVRRGTFSDEEIRQRVADRMRAVGLAGSERKYPNELSGGMRKRAAIARATIAEPEIVIYDEPTAGLDPVTTSKIYDLLTELQGRQGGTVIAISSDVQALRGFVGRIAMLYQGRLRYDGDPKTIDASDDPVVRQFVRGDLEGPL
jgi:phospholipid/cholesterol/gamma-HCH transport system ATP-binding protein